MVVEVKVIELPAQILEPVDEILTEAETFVETVMVIELDVAGEPAAQTALEVITTLTTSPLFKRDEVNVTELLPAFVPFTFH